MFIDRWPCRFKTETKEEEDAVIFVPERLLFRRVGGALKTWDCVLWANKGKEISVMWDFYTARAQKSDTSIFFSWSQRHLPPPPELWSDQTPRGEPAASEEELTGSHGIIAWAHMESWDRVVVWGWRPLRMEDIPSTKEESFQYLWNRTHAIALFACVGGAGGNGHPSYISPRCLCRLYGPDVSDRAAGLPASLQLDLTRDGKYAPWPRRRAGQCGPVPPERAMPGAVPFARSSSQIRSATLFPCGH